MRLRHRHPESEERCRSRVTCPCPNGIIDLVPLIVIFKVFISYRGFRILSKDPPEVRILGKGKRKLAQDDALNPRPFGQDCRRIPSCSPHDFEPFALIKLVKHRRGDLPVGCPWRLGKLPFILGVGKLSVGPRQIVRGDQSGVVDDLLDIGHEEKPMVFKRPAAKLLRPNLPGANQRVDLSEERFPAVNFLASSGADQLHHLCIVALNHVVGRRGTSLGFGDRYGKVLGRRYVCQRHLNIQPEPFPESIGQGLNEGFAPARLYGRNQFPFLLRLAHQLVEELFPLRRSLG